MFLMPHPKTGKSLDFLLFMSWLPPGPQIPDAVEGTLKFASAIKNIKGDPDE